MINHYEFGSITINGKEYQHDVIVYGDASADDQWWREESHNMTVKDLKCLPDTFDALVIGNGATSCCLIPKETIKHFGEKGEVIVQKTGEAVKTFNQLLSEGKDVVGAFHLTC